MSDIEASAKAFLHFGHRYQVTAAFKSGLDVFSPGEQFVYAGSATSVRDAAIGFFFYDTENGKTKRYDSGWDTTTPNEIRFASVLKDLGPDMVVRSIELTGQLNDINWECFKKHAAYLQDYVEGKAGIKSWFVWLEENLPELQTVASRAQLLRLKNKGPHEAQAILTQLQIPFKPSPRYGWTGG
jgi:hypothetical protein